MLAAFAMLARGHVRRRAAGVMAALGVIRATRAEEGRGGAPSCCARHRRFAGIQPGLAAGVIVALAGASRWGCSSP